MIPAAKGWLLDTHTLLWMIHGDKRLSKNAARAIDGKFPVHHSSVSFWEIAIKLSGKGFDFEVDNYSSRTCLFRGPMTLQAKQGRRRHS